MSIPFALSLDKYVNKAGTDVGFGCLLAVALLVLLYFAAARETRTLRDHLEDAHDRITDLEARMAQALRNQAAARSQQTQVPSVPGRPGVVPAPSVAQPMGSAVARVQREGAAAATGASAVTGALLGAPAGAGAPSLGSATKLIPSPEPAVTPAVGVPMAVPAAATAAAASAAGASAGGVSEAYADIGDDDFDDFEPDDTMFVPAGASAVAAGGRGGGGPAVAPPPSAHFGDEDPAGPPPRRTIPTVDYGPERPRRISRLLGAAIVLLVAAAIVVALLVITKNGSSNKSKTTAAQTTVVKKQPTTKVVFNPAKVKVSVLNGTGQSGLAGDVAALVKKSGYTVPAASITNADIQTVTTTTVGYRPGFRADAFRVAKSLSKTSGVAVTDVVAANSTSITSCATPTATGQTGSCPASVIVTVGTDLESAASGTTSG